MRRIRISLCSNLLLEIWFVKLPWNLDLLTTSFFYNSITIVGFKSSLFDLQICCVLINDFRRPTSMLYGQGVTTT